MASALLLALFCLSCARVNADTKGCAAIAAAFVSHSMLAIALGVRDPQSIAPLLPGSEDYWQKQLTWIRSGIDPEYQLAAWVPAHLQLLAGMLLFCSTSLGTLTFYRGFIEVDLMNYYNSQVLLQCGDLRALLFGWHPWSILRGAGYVLLSFELISLTLQWITGRATSSPERRIRRWVAALSFLLADGIVKYTLMEPVRAELHRFIGG